MYFSWDTKDAEILSGLVAHPTSETSAKHRPIFVIFIKNSLVKKLNMSCRDGDMQGQFMPIPHWGVHVAKIPQRLPQVHLMGPVFEQRAVSVEFDLCVQMAHNAG
jgi:hypothetical protein